MKQQAVLVASNDEMFADMVGRMVAEAGFRPEYLAPDEPAWLSMARIEPFIAICDCASTGDGVRLVVVEAAARRIPMLLMGADMHSGWRRVTAIGARIVCLTFPVSRGTFVAALDGLLPPALLHLVPADPVAAPATL